MSKLLGYAEIAKDFVQTAVDNTVNTIEQVHLSIAQSAADTLIGNPSDNPNLVAAFEKHQQAAQGVYGAIRKVNRALGEWATDGFEALENSQTAARRHLRD